jgi:hypothetical protein
LSVNIIPFLTLAEVKNLAKGLAMANDIDLRSYDEPVVTSEVTGGELTWRVSFQAKSPGRPGGHFVVLIKDSTKQATYLAGE